jgi:hypothetical protein
LEEDGDLNEEEEYQEIKFWKNEPLALVHFVEKE